MAPYSLVSVIHRNWPWKLLSLAVAFALFYVIRAQISDTVTISVPVLVEPASGTAIESVSPSSVQVTFRGSARSLQQIDRRDILAELTPPRFLMDDEKQQDTFEIKPRNIKGTDGLQIVQIVPQAVEVRFDRQATFSFPLDPPVLTGRPLKGVASVSLETNIVRVTGSLRTLGELRRNGVRLQTTPIDTEGVAQGFSARIRVLPPPSTMLSAIVPLELSALVTLSTRNTQRDFPDIPIRVVQSRTPGKRLFASPPYATLRLFGGSEVLQAVRTESLAVFAEKEGTNVLTRICVPPEIAIERAVIIPETVSLQSEESN